MASISYQCLLLVVISFVLIEDSFCIPRACGYCRTPGMVTLGFDFDEFVNMREPDTEIDRTSCVNPEITFCDSACIKMRAVVKGTKQVYRLLDCSENYLSGYERFNKSQMVRFEGEKATWTVEFCSSTYCFGTTEDSPLSDAAQEYLDRIKETLPPAPSAEPSINSIEVPESETVAPLERNPKSNASPAPMAFSWISMIFVSVLSVIITLMVLLGCVTFFVFRYANSPSYMASQVRVNSQAVPLTSTKSIDSCEMADPHTERSEVASLHSRFTENYYLNV